MQPKTPKLLEDIRDAAAFIREATRGKTSDDYRRERLLRQAIERNFEIAGEAINRLAQHDPDAQPASASTGRSSDSATFSCTATTSSITASSGMRLRRRCRCG